MFAMYGPEVGRRQYLTLYRQRGWEQVLRDFLLVNQEYFYIFGDSAYLLRPWMQRPLSRDLEKPNQLLFNTAMNDVRVSVEQNYKDRKRYWASQELSRNLKVQKSQFLYSKNLQHCSSTLDHSYIQVAKYFRNSKYHLYPFMNTFSLSEIYSSLLIRALISFTCEDLSSRRCLLSS